MGKHHRFRVSRFSEAEGLTWAPTLPTEAAKDRVAETGIHTALKTPESRTMPARTAATALIAIALGTLSAPGTAAPPPTPPLVAPLLAQGGAALVQPGGIQELAKKANEARPEMVQADPAPAEAPAAADDAADAEAAAPKKASPLELRYFISYVLILAFVGGGTALAIRPSGRKPQSLPKPAANAKPAAKK